MRRHDSSALAVAAALFTSQHSEIVFVCVWSAGTGTADPPLTPGGVYRALEERGREDGERRADYGHDTERIIPFTQEEGEGGRRGTTRSSEHEKFISWAFYVCPSSVRSH